MKRNRIQFPWRLGKLAACIGAAVVLCWQGAIGQTIPNPSFETDTFTTFPGYISGNTEITGWAGTPPERVGLNPGGGSPFADNGTIPAGNNVAFIQAPGDGSTATLSTTLSDLVVGTTYRVTFRANARANNTPNLKIYVDGVAVLLPGGPDGLSLAAVTGSNPYWHVGFEFTATATSQSLALVNDAIGDHTVLVDDFKIAPSTGKWSVEAWTGDEDSGVNSDFLYTHAYNFGSGDSPTINGIAFTGVAGTAPAVAGKFSTTYLAAGPVGDTSINVGGNSATMASAFVYGGNVPASGYQSITLQGLTPGTEYVVTIYSVAWEDASVPNRWATFSVGNDYLTLNQDQFYNNSGIRISYRYTADASGTVTVKFSPLVPANLSFHVYGFANREAVSRFVAPSITGQPKDTIVSPDLPVTLNVIASGVPLPTYQWRFNGGVIADATDAALVLPAVTAANAGGYDVVVSNRAGVVTSAVARLTVGLPMTNPSFELDAFFVWPGYVSGNGPITGWASLPNHGINPADGSPFADNGITPHGVQVAFMQGDGALSQTVSGFTVGAQYYVHYYENGRVGGTSYPALEVKIGGVTVVKPHSIAPVGGGSYYEISSEAFVATATDMELAFIKSNPAGGDSTALVDNVAIVPLAAGTPPSITLQPQSTTVYLGSAASFAGRALGSQPVAYQWLFNGAPLAGATDNVLNLSPVRLADEGDYVLVAANSSGSVTSSVAKLALLEAIPSLHNTGISASGTPLAAGAVDPSWTLLVNPDGGGASVYVGNDAWPIGSAWAGNNSVSKWVGSRASVGDADIPLGDYQYRTTFDLTGRDTNTVIILGRWLSDNWGTPIRVNGEILTAPMSDSFTAWAVFAITPTNATLLPGLNTIDFVVNNAGAGPTGVRVEFTKASARTLPGIPAAVAVPPQGSTVAEGDTVVMTVSATGTLPLTYQWKKGNVDLAGKTDASLTLTAVTTNDAGIYRVAVSNAWGGEVSAGAEVIVAYRPIPGIFGTGLDASGALLPDGAVDPHYVLSASADANYPGPDAVAITNVWPIQAGVWLPNGPYSRWIGASAAQRQDVDPAQGNAPGLYTYQTTFNLAGYDLTKVHLTGGVAADNGVVDVLINGVSTGFTVAGFGALVPFTLPGTALLPGANTLDIIVSNAETAGADPFAPNPAGLRVDMKGYLDIRPAAPTTTLQINRSGDSVSVSWSPAASGQKLQWAPTVNGPWEEISGAPNPYTTTASGAPKFYRIVQ